MAITSLTGAVAGAQPLWFFSKNATAGSGATGKLFSFWSGAGYPGAGSYNSTLNGGTYSSSGGLVNGQIPHFDPVSGNSYLMRFQCQGVATSAGNMILLLDRIWDNGGITISSSSLQTIASPTWPARDNNGATSGVGILLALEISAVCGAGTPTISIGYTNQAGTASRTGTNIDTPVTAAPVGAWYRIGLQAGDTGVQSVQSLTFGGTPWATGTANLVAYRVLAALEQSVAAQSFAIDAFTGGFPQIFNGTVPFLVCLNGSSTNPGLVGQYGETQG